MEWPEEPPDQVEVHKKFNITYHATIVTGRFYSSNLIFPNKRYKSRESASDFFGNKVRESA